MSILAILHTGVRRTIRDRTALLFLIVMPIVIILIVGATVGGFTSFHVGIVDLGSGRLGRQLVVSLEHAPTIDITRYGSVAQAKAAVARSEVSTAVLLPEHMTSDLRAGKIVKIQLVAEPFNSSQQAAAQAVSSQITVQGRRMQAALFATANASGSFEQNLARATSIELNVPLVRVNTEVVQSVANTLPEGFSYSAPTMLVLFVFLNALAGGATIIETRRLGIYERMATMPLRPSAIVAGEFLTYVTIALAQALLIVLVGSAVFGVSWGEPFGAIILIAVWSVVGGAAGMLSGAVFHTPEQASSIGPAIGIAMAMLGGCMWPLSIVNTLMREIGHATPQAWAVDAWTKLIARHGSVGNIAPELGILVAFALGFLVLATFRLRRLLTHGA